MPQDKDERRQSTSPPALGLAIAELPRALFELACLLPGHAILSNAPAGDGHPVFTLPGYRSNDAAMLILRRYLARWGYDPYPWGLGTNLGIGYERLNYEARLLEKVEKVVARRGEPATLIGWSQGGVIAREIAKKRPDLVRQIITLGSPVADAPHATTVFRIFRHTGSYELTSDLMAFLREVASPVPDVRCICIYSRTDGIVSAELAQDLVSPNAENIGINASHLGMAVNPSVLYIIADRLAQPEEDWRPFDANVVNWLFSRAS